MPIDERFIVLVLTAGANLFLGLVVWRKNPTQQVNQRFGLICVTVAVWAVSNGLVNAYADSRFGIIWARAAFVAAAAIPLSFLFFVLVFPSHTVIIRSRFNIAVFSSGLVIGGLSATPLVAQRTASVGGVLHVVYGPLHLVFAGYFTVVSAYTLALLYRKLANLSGLERLQATYFVLGVSLAIIGGSMTNLFIPLVFQTSRFSVVGPLFTIPMVSVIGHAIVRYRLMNTRLVIRRGFVYLLAIATVSLTFLATLWLGSRLLPSRTDLPLWLELSIVVIIAVSFYRLKDLVQRWADRYFFRQTYDYQKVIRDISKQMATILDLNSLLAYTCDAIARTVQPEYVVAYARALDGNTYEPLVVRHAIATIAQFASMQSDGPFPRFLTEARKPVLVDELGAVSKGGASAQEVRTELASLRAEAALPIHDAHTLSGFLLLGAKLSADPYFSEDIDLLTTVTSQAAIAMQNARLYSQVVLANNYVENILDTIDNAVIAVDCTGTVTRFNSAAERLTGTPAAYIKGGSVQLLPAVIRGLLHIASADAGAQTQTETVVPDAGGRRSIPVICSTSPLRDTSGSILGAVAVISDLTGLKRLEEEKRQVERLASIGALASGIAHEIKNPLVAIRTFAELLPDRFSDEDFRNNFSQIALKEIERIDDLVGRLRGLANARQSHTSLNILNPLKETLALLQAQLEQSRTSVDLEVEDNLPDVAGNFVQLKQLFLNLLVNALEATESGGNFAIRTRSHSTRAGTFVVVDITDNGSGISNDVLARIFEPFVTTKQHGSGLGLSICRGITDAHRATIRARNNSPGPGATITVEFPALLTVPAPSDTHREPLPVPNRSRLQP